MLSTPIELDGMNDEFIHSRHPSHDFHPHFHYCLLCRCSVYSQQATRQCGFGTVPDMTAEPNKPNKPNKPKKDIDWFAIARDCSG